MKKYWSGALPEPGIRTIADMANVLARPITADPQTPLYYMYRDLWKTHGDHTWLERHHLRYDITVIPPGILNGRSSVYALNTGSRSSKFELCDISARHKLIDISLSVADNVYREVVAIVVISGIILI